MWTHRFRPRNLTIMWIYLCENHFVKNQESWMNDQKFCCFRYFEGHLRNTIKMLSMVSKISLPYPDCPPLPWTIYSVLKPNWGSSLQASGLVKHFPPWLSGSSHGFKSTLYAFGWTIPWSLLFDIKPVVSLLNRKYTSAQPEVVRWTYFLPFPVVIIIWYLNIRV